MTEIKHPDLGPIRFDDGKADPKIAGSKNSLPQWVCRPEGWNWESDFEIYLPGSPELPSNLDLAVSALRHREQIEIEGKKLATGDIELVWIDLTTNPPTAAFIDNEKIYVLWTGVLDYCWRITEFTEGNW